jgi:rubrerythrin
MSWKLFLSTFVLIFLAELGDKTQLAAMARSASAEGAKWVVFWAAASALVLSTLVAVLFGHVLTKFIPEHVLKLTAGGLFILFGILILYQTLTSERVATTKHAPEHVPGLMAGVVLKWAGEFERAAASDYDALSEQATDPKLKALLGELAAEEREHVERVRHASTEHESLQLAPNEASVALPERDALNHDVAKADRPLLEHAIEHEEATAQFYAELARLTPLPGLKQTFTRLAEAEKDHARRLRALG